HHEVLPTSEWLEHAGSQRAVAAFPVNTGPFEEFVCGDLLIELFRREKMVVHTVDFARPRCARGGGDNTGKRRVFIHQPVAEGAFPRTSGPGENHENGRLISLMSHCRTSKISIRKRHESQQRPVTHQQRSAGTNPTRPREEALKKIAKSKG